LLRAQDRLLTALTQLTHDTQGDRVMTQCIHQIGVIMASHRGARR
jgi:hypothetical protein